jgi:hypothetical protein
MFVTVGLVMMCMAFVNHSVVAQSSSGSSGDGAGGDDWIPIEEYRRQHQDDWIPADEYRRRQADDWIPLEPRTDFWDEFWQRVQGSRMIFTGVRLVQWGAGTTVVVLADDWTVIGVANDPLVLVTGGTAVAGGVILIGGGVYLVIETLYDQ